MEIFSWDLASTRGLLGKLSLNFPMLLAWRPCFPLNRFELVYNYFDHDLNPQQLNQTTLDLSLVQVDLLVTRRQLQSDPRPYANSMGKT